MRTPTKIVYLRVYYDCVLFIVMLIVGVFSVKFKNFEQFTVIEYSNAWM